MNSLFDSAGLAIVAYAKVLADGHSEPVNSSDLGNYINSGVVTTKTGAGQYSITLPGGTGQQTQQMFTANDLIFVTPKGTAHDTYSALTAVVDDSDPQTKKVAIYGGANLASFADADFSVLILRTLLPEQNT